MRENLQKGFANAADNSGLFPPRRIPRKMPIKRQPWNVLALGGKAVRGQMEEKQVLQEIFPDVGEDVQYLLQEVARMIREEQIYSGTSIKVAENVAAKFSLKKGLVQIVRAEKVEKARSI